jgi:DNA-binding MarR family transcriptional regulator
VAKGSAQREARHASGASGEGARLQSISGGIEAVPSELDRLIHERMRLGIVSALAVNQRLAFNDLKEMLGATDGNLSVHARKLEEAGYVACIKGFDGRIPRTVYELTSAGRGALEQYLEHMEALIHAVRDH